LSSSDPRVALVGVGYWGPNLARNFHDLGSLDLVCDRNPAMLERMRERFPGIRTTDRLEAVLADPAIDGVVLATPAPTHHPLARQALEAGKHVMVEKPLALSQREADDLAKLAVARERILMVGHILVYHPAVEALVSLVREGALGEVKHVRSERMSLGKLRHEENVLWSFGPHDASLLTELVQGEPDHVQAFGHAILQPHIEDVVTVDVRYASGVTAHLHLSWLEPTKRHRLTVIGTRQMAVFDDTLAEGKLRLYDSGFDHVDGIWSMRQNGETVISYEAGEPMKRETQHFLDCIRTGLQPRTDGASGARVLGILERAQACLTQMQGASC